MEDQMIIDPIGNSSRDLLSSGPDIQRFLEDAVKATEEYARRSGGKFNSYASTPEYGSRHSTTTERRFSAAAEQPDVDSRLESGGTVLARFASCWNAGHKSTTAVVYPDSKTRVVQRNCEGKPESPVHSFRRSFSMYTRSLSSRFS